MVVQYDGTDFAGFQRQASQNRPTVQGTLEAALARLTGQPARVVGAARTDAGVHALGQVVHWRTTHPIPVRRLPAALNDHLPLSIRVVAAEEAPSSFHARRDATSRIYCYHILNRPLPSALAGRFAWWIPGALQLEPMVEVARALVGRRDFARFGSPLRAGQSTVRTVYASRLDVQALADGGRALRLAVEADAFLYRMVRLLAGLMVRVGLGELDVGVAMAALSAQVDGNRASAADHRAPRLAPAAPARGLCLVHVHFGPPPAGLDVCGSVLDTLSELPLEWRPG